MNRSRSLIAVALSVAASSPSFAQAPPETLGARDDDVIGVRMLGHRAVLDVLETPSAITSLGDGGLVIRWQAGTPVAFHQFPGATDLALDGETVVLAAADGLLWLDDTLTVSRSQPADGFAPCRGASALWAWDTDANQVRFISPDGERTVAVESPPLGDASCTWTDGAAALAWHDGSDAIAVTTGGEHLQAPWDTDAPPRAIPSRAGWTLSERAPAHAAGVCDGASADGWLQCASPSPVVAERLLAPSPRAITAGLTFDGGVVFGGPAGWARVSLQDATPDVALFDDPLVGVIASPTATVFTCSLGRLSARDVTTGDVLSEIAVESCPARLRMVSTRAVFHCGSTDAVWDTESAAFVARAADSDDARFEVRSSWSAPCGEIATEVVTASGERVFGPVCGGLQLAAMVDADGRELGAALCREGEGPAFALDRFGAEREPPIADNCDAAIRVAATTESDPVLARDALRTLRQTPHGALLRTPTERVSITWYDTGVSLATPDTIWASDVLWDQLVWSRGGSTFRLTDAETAAVWRPAVLGATDPIPWWRLGQRIRTRSD